MITYFARHPTAANLLMVIMLAAGILSVGRLQRETFPDALPTIVEVSVVFPGATASEVEETITQRLEDALDSVQFLKEMKSVARQSIGSVTLEMKDGGDYTAFRNEIDNSVSGIDDFPDDARPPITTRKNTRQRVMDVLVSGPMTATSLKAFCEQTRSELMALGDVSDVGIDGFSDHLLRVELSREAMLRYGLSTTDVSQAISSQSLDLPAGKIDGDETVLVRVQESRKTRLALEDLTITGRLGGAEVRLGDIAVVKDEFEIDEDKVSTDGKRSAVLQIRKAKSEDSLKVAAAVEGLLERKRQEYPGVELTVINDSSELVKDRIGLLLKNGWQGCLLVFATMWLFFNARLSFWVVASLPVSFLAAFAFVPMFGLTINMLTMVGLLMALGLLMDDGIVIAENIARRRSEGEPAMQAAVNGVKEVGGGVFSSFLTTCSVLGPLIFLNGEIGKILRVLPMMLLLVLATSLVEAFLILPAHLGHSLASEGGNKSNAVRRFFDRLIESSRELVGRIVAWCVAWRYLVAGLVFLVFFSTLSLTAGGFVRFKVFPDLEGDTIVARVLMPPGTPLKRTEAVVADLLNALHETNDEFQPEQPGEQALVLTTFVRFSKNTDANETGSHVATVQADLLTNEVRTCNIDQILSTWREKLGPVADAVNLTFDEPSIGPAGRDIELELSGRTLEEMDAASSEIQAFLKTFDGVTNISDDLRRGETEMLVSLRPGAMGLGVGTTDFARQLRGSFQGLLSDQIQVGEEAYDVEVRFGDEDRDSLADLENYRLTSPAGDVIPLGELATLDRRRGWSRIGRTDGKQVVNVVANVDSTKSNAAAAIAKVKSEVLPGLQEQYPGLEVAVKGASENGRETGQSMGIAAVIGCLGVFVILSFQFRSYTEPLIVMAAIPFAFVGVVWGHWVYGQNLSLPSIMGYASLAGIVVNDSILLILFLKSRLAEGASLVEAATESSRLRFRAVMITSLTTIAGLLPLLAERSLQAQVLIPIAISICFGLMASTVLILLVLPPMYVLLSDWGLADRGGPKAEH
ncbi:MAG: efflux RND transporter permease subunit [Aureliella sp.]